MRRYDKYFSEISLKPSDGGRFEITLNDKLIYSKLETNRFPDQKELLEQISQEIGLN